MTDPIANEALAHTRAVGGGACLPCGSRSSRSEWSNSGPVGTAAAGSSCPASWPSSARDLVEIEMFACRICRHVEYLLPAGGS